MKAEGTFKLNELPYDLEECVFLAKEKVARGVIYVKETKPGEGYLILSPNAAVKFHDHVNDSETYTDVMSGCSEECPKGSGHELINTSSENWLLVKFVKQR